ncbi:MAG: DUF1304 domain-containing protein [Snowella sp.]|nr:DUF1304 domain-containing protein [Snowella sp.]
MNITRLGVLLIAVIHFGLAIAEIFFGAYFLEKRLDFPPEVAQQAEPIVQNAGIYNSFIAAGLVWAALAAKQSLALRYFFLSCVIIAGVFGAFTLRPTTLILQTVPALIVLGLVWWKR